LLAFFGFLEDFFGFFEGKGVGRQIIPPSGVGSQTRLLNAADINKRPVL